MAPKTVPSKIVIAGNSKMSLNERFTTIPKPRQQIMKPKYAPKVYQNAKRVYDQYPQPTEFFQQRPLTRGRPRQHQNFNSFKPRHVPVVQVPIQNRVTFVKTISQQQRNFNYVPNFNNHQKNFVRKPFRPNFHGAPQFRNSKPFVANKFHKVPAKNSSHFQVPPKKSLAELDRELEDYMRKPKHTPITI